MLKTIPSGVSRYHLPLYHGAQIEQGETKENSTGTLRGAKGRRAGHRGWA